VIHLSSKLIVSFSPSDVEGLEDARPSQLNEMEISPSGFGIHFPAVDADLYIPGLCGPYPFAATQIAVVCIPAGGGPSPAQAQPPPGEGGAEEGIPPGAGRGGRGGPGGPLVKAGNYTVTLGRLLNGVVTPLGKPQTVEVVPLEPSNR